MQISMQILCFQVDEDGSELSDESDVTVRLGKARSNNGDGGVGVVNSLCFPKV